MGLFVVRAVLECTANHIWKHKTVPRRVPPVTHVRMERIRRQQVLSTPLIATNVRPEKKIQTMVPAAVLHAMIVVPTQKQPRKERRNSMFVTTVRPRKKAVPNVKPVGRGHTAMGVSLVPKVTTATAVTLLRSLAAIAQPGTTVMALVKVPVYHAYPANSTMMPVLSNANFAKRILFQATKFEPCPVIHAPPESPRRQEA